MDELLRKRGRLKAKLTRIQSFVDQFSTVPVTSTDVKIRLDMLNEIWLDFDQTQTKLECTCQEDQLEEQQIEQEAFEKTFCSVKAMLIQALEQLTLQVQPTINSPSTSNGTSRNVPNVKLPTIELPTFSGNFQQWNTFADLFTSVIHQSDALSPVQKLHYLKSSLRGDASRLLNSIAVTDANYDEAWKILKDRYSNKRQIIQSHLRSLHNQVKLSTESPTDLRGLLDVTVENVRALHALGLPTQQWDCLVLFLITERLDSNTRKQWELSIADNDDPTFKQLKEFIEKRCRALEVSGTEKRKAPTATKVDKTGQRTNTTLAYHAAVVANCVGCKGQHHLYQCEKFLKLPVEQRITLVKTSSLCFNCLRGMHRATECKATKCKRCQQRHNTLLHREKKVEDGTDAVIVSNHHVANPKMTQVLLATAVINVRDQTGDWQQVRALLDSGSQASFVPSGCVQRLGLKQQKTNIKINGLGSSNLASCTGTVRLHLSSACTQFSCEVQALVTHTVTMSLPLHPLDPKELADSIHRYDVQLADPQYYKPGSVDILMVADIYYELLLSGRFRALQSPIMFQNTTLGWIISGPTGSEQHQVVTHFNVVELSQQLKSFWELEDTKEARQYTTEEIECESHFKDNYSRTEEGRFVVRLPFRNNVANLGLSSFIAQQRLLII